MLVRQSNSSFEIDEKLKCLRFDLEDVSIQYIICREFQEWRYKQYFGNRYETVQLYKKVKKFKSKSELDLWCSINGVEYEFVNSLNLIGDDEN